MIYPITPIGKPRMTRADAWKKRKAVTKYWDWKDEVLKHIAEIPQPAKITFWVPMPESWSKKKKDKFEGLPHLQKPDLDNMLKALLDAVYGDDAMIWNVHAQKRWARAGAIGITEGPRI